MDQTQVQLQPRPTLSEPLGQDGLLILKPNEWENQFLPKPIYTGSACVIRHLTFTRIPSDHDEVSSKCQDTLMALMALIPVRNWGSIMELSESKTQ